MSSKIFDKLIYHHNSSTEHETHPSSNLVINVRTARESYSLYTSSLESRTSIPMENG